MSGRRAFHDRSDVHHCLMSSSKYRVRRSYCNTKTTGGTQKRRLHIPNKTYPICHIYSQKERRSNISTNPAHKYHDPTGGAHQQRPPTSRISNIPSTNHRAHKQRWGSIFTVQSVRAYKKRNSAVSGLFHQQNDTVRSQKAHTHRSHVSSTRYRRELPHQLTRSTPDRRASPLWRRRGRHSP